MSALFQLLVLRYADQDSFRAWLRAALFRPWSFERMASRAYRLNGTDFAYEIFDDEVVVLDLGTGSYFALGGCAVVFWEALAKSLPIESITEALSRLYPAQNGALAVDLESFVARLVEEKILLEAEASNEKVASIASHAPRDYSAPTFEKHDDMQDLLTLDPIHDVDPQKGWPYY